MSERCCGFCGKSFTPIAGLYVGTERCGDTDRVYCSMDCYVSGGTAALRAKTVHDLVLQKEPPMPNDAERASPGESRGHASEPPLMYPATREELDELRRRFSQPSLTTLKQRRMRQILHAALGLGKVMLACCPPGRERDLALTRLEEAVSWAQAATNKEEVVHAGAVSNKEEGVHAEAATRDTFQAMVEAGGNGPGVPPPPDPDPGSGHGWCWTPDASNTAGPPSFPNTDSHGRPVPQLDLPQPRPQ